MLGSWDDDVITSGFTENEVRTVTDNLKDKFRKVLFDIYMKEVSHESISWEEFFDKYYSKELF